MNLTNIPEDYKNEDTIYHYTSIRVALEYILPSMKLRLSPRNTAIDPIERLKSFISFSDSGIKRDWATDKGYEIKNEIKEIEKSVKQICFCQNPEKITGQNKLYSIEDYGFSKPRMWDQYGDRYNGVCLVFSLTKLKNECTKKFHHHDLLKYLTYKEFEVKHRSIDINRIREIGYEKYKSEYINYFKSRLFWKHRDYAGENEYRFCSFTNQSYDYLDISNSLKGIIVSNNSINIHLYPVFQNFLRQDKSRLQIISFNDGSINIK